MGKTSNLTIPCLSVKFRRLGVVLVLRPAPVTVLQLLQLFNNKYLLLFKVKKSDNYNFPCCIRHICYE